MAKKIVRKSTKKASKVESKQLDSVESLIKKSTAQINKFSKQVKELLDFNQLAFSAHASRLKALEEDVAKIKERLAELESPSGALPKQRKQKHVAVFHVGDVDLRRPPH